MFAIAHHEWLPTILFWIASLFFFLAYAIRDIFWLRILTIVGCLATLPYYYFQKEPLLSAAICEIIFILINLYNLIELIKRRQPVVLSPDQQKLHLKTLSNFTPQEMLALLAQAEMKQVEANTIVNKEGSAHAELILILVGKMNIVAQGKHVATIEDGNFACEMSYVTGEVTSADVIAATSCAYFVWQKVSLDSYLKNNPEQASQLQVALGRDMAKKIKTLNQ